jgi:hypothetical protein
MEQAVLSQVRAVFRSPEMIVQTYLEAKKLEAEEECDTTLTQWDVIDALKKFDPAWEALNPAEQRRVVGCLVESVTVTSNGLDVQFRTDGIHSLITSINDDNEKAE